jgi:hypothetical protein
MKQTPMHPYFVKDFPTRLRALNHFLDEKYINLKLKTLMEF